MTGPTRLCIVHWERGSQSPAPPVRYSGGGTRSFKTWSVAVETKCASGKSLFRNILPVTPLYGIPCERSCKMLKINGLR